MYFAMQILEKYLIKPQTLQGGWKWIWRIVTLLTVNFGWVLFNSLSLSDAARYIAGMLGLRGLPLYNSTVALILREYGVFLALGFLFATPIAVVCGCKIRKKKWSTYLLSFGEMAVFLWAVSFVVLGAYNPFIYFNF